MTLPHAACRKVTGAVVCCYKDGAAFEEEFVTAEGRTISPLTLSRARVGPLADSNALRVWELAHAAAWLLHQTEEGRAATRGHMSSAGAVEGRAHAVDTIAISEKVESRSHSTEARCRHLLGRSGTLILPREGKPRPPAPPSTAVCCPSLAQSACRSRRAVPARCSPDR